MHFATVVLAAAALGAAPALAWGNDGHMTVGFVAMQFLGPKTLSFVQTSLGSDFNESLGTAATWADSVRSTAAFSWSAPFHFVDAEDNPPTSCSVSETRDCASGTCILTAIANYTSRVAKTSLSADERQIALKFVDHFLGDIGQPLHVEAFEVGGNNIDVKCSGKSTNLHAAWDTGMLDKNMNATHGNSVTTYANDLVARIKTGAYKNLTTSWLSCVSPTKKLTSRELAGADVEEHNIQRDIDALLGRAPTPTGTALAERATVTPLACPLVWATEANAFDCSFVFTFSNFTDLCTTAYFTGAVPIIDLQLAKQGYRLAAWLNTIFDGSPLLP